MPMQYFSRVSNPAGLWAAISPGQVYEETFEGAAVDSGKLSQEVLVPLQLGVHITYGYTPQIKWVKHYYR